jgi:tRNA(Ile)-lysidine synthase
MSVESRVSVRDPALELVEQVRAGGLLATGQGVVVLLSGGRDSVCLLDVAVAIAGADCVRALHVNYGLREGATGDEALCAELCARLGVTLTVRRPDPEGRVGNLQAWAREVRYAAAAELAGLANGSAGPAGAGRDVAIAAGHTATDQVETILYRLASSPSRRALLGMRPREGRLIRPLLACTRAETGAYCRARGLDWREDETNASARFARGRVRGSLVPALREIHPAAEANVLALAETLRSEAEVLDALVDQVLAGGSSIPLSRLRELPPALARLVVQWLADDAAGRPAPGVARRLEEIVALRETGTAALDLPSGIRAVAVRGVVSFSARDGGARP